MKNLICFFLCSFLFFSCTNDSKKVDSSDSTKVSANSADAKDYEFGDTKFVDIAKQGMANLSSGDIDTWMTHYADNAVYRWNNGDSLSGKAAIAEYWTKRRKEMIESLSYSNEVWLSLKVNKPQYPSQLTGNYALSWNMVDAKYKTGKSMSQRMHTVFHFDANNKIDRVSQYLDRAPINAAIAK